MPTGPIPKGDAARARLVDAMADLVQERGYAATGVSEVLARASLPKGSLYHHFPGGKEELGTAAVETAAARIDAAIGALLERAATPADAVRALAGAQAVGLEASRFARGCPIATVALETAHVSDPLAGATAAGFGAWTDRFAAALTDHGFAPEAARGRATLILSALEGALVLARAQRDAAPLRTVAEQLAPLLDPPG